MYCSVHNDVEVSDPTLHHNTDPDLNIFPKLRAGNYGI
jgi:hypothetical protein